MMALDDASKIAAAIAADTLGRDHVVSALSQQAIDALGRDALSVTIVIRPGAADHFQGDDLIATLARLHHSLEDAGDDQRLIVRPLTGGPTRQVDLRRSVSTSYYGVFHAILAGIADQFVGATLRLTGEYGRVYRSVDHKTLRVLCDDVRRKVLPAKYVAHAPSGGFGVDVTECARATADLQDRRYLADYDPLSRFGAADALLALKVARTALVHLRRAPVADRRAFYSLVLFPPRR